MSYAEHLSQTYVLFVLHNIMLYSNIYIIGMIMFSFETHSLNPLDISDFFHDRIVPRRDVKKKGRKKERVLRPLRPKKKRKREEKGEKDA